MSVADRSTIMLFLQKQPVSETEKPTYLLWNHSDFY